MMMVCNIGMMFVKTVIRVRLTLRYKRIRQSKIRQLELLRKEEGREDKEQLVVAVKSKKKHNYTSKKILVLDITD